MILDKDTYESMKELVLKYEQELLNKNIETEQEPYIVKYSINVEFKYNPNYGDDRICECGHSYYRHFDPYENMEAVGCKYCQCYDFIEKVDIVKLRNKKIAKILNKTK